MYGGYSDKELNEWEKFNAILLTSSAFGAWLMRRDEKRDKRKLEQAKAELALEQEPVLDKIRDEIKHFMYDVNPSSSESDYACNYILQIIDKYKAESESDV